MLNFEMIINFLNTDKRFNYIHDILNDNIEVYIKNSNSKFTVIKDNHGIKVISGIGSLTGIFKVSFNTYDMTSFKKAVETIYRSSTIEDEQPEEDKMAEINHILADHNSITDFGYQSKEVVEYPRGGNTMPNQTVNKSFDFLNDYKVVKLAERAINDNFAELAEAFFNFSNSEEELETILSCGNSKVLFFAHGSNRKITIEFGQDGEEPFRYVHTNNGINMLNDYDPAALNTIGNLIDAAVNAWLEDDENRMNTIDLNNHMLSLVDNIKTMISLINTTIRKYNV